MSQLAALTLSKAPPAPASRREADRLDTASDPFEGRLKRAWEDTSRPGEGRDGAAEPTTTDEKAGASDDVTPTTSGETHRIEGDARTPGDAPTSPNAAQDGPTGAQDPTTPDATGAGRVAQTRNDDQASTPRRGEHARRVSIQSLTDLLLTADPALLRSLGVVHAPTAGEGEVVGRDLSATNAEARTDGRSRSSGTPNGAQKPAFGSPAPVDADAGAAEPGTDDIVPERVTPSRVSSAERGHGGSIHRVEQVRPDVASAPLTQAVQLGAAQGARPDADPGARGVMTSMKVADAGRLGPTDGAPTSGQTGVQGEGAGTQSGGGGARDASFASSLAESKGAEPRASTEAALRAQVMRGLAAAMRSEGGEVTLRMRPAVLGALKVSIRKPGSNDAEAGRGLSARFEVASDETRELLEKSLPSLRQALESKGLDVDCIEVYVAEQPAQNPDGAFAFAQGEGRERAGDGAARGSREGTGVGPADDATSGDGPGETGWRTDGSGRLVRLALDTIG